MDGDERLDQSGGSAGARPQRDPRRSCDHSARRAADPAHAGFCEADQPADKGDWECVIMEDRMTYLNRLFAVFALSISLTLSCSAAEGTTCSPTYQPPPQPFVDEVYRCLYTVIDSIKRKESGDYSNLGERLVKSLLLTKITDYNTVNEIPWERLAEVIAILDSQSLIDLFVQRIGAPRDGEETDSAYAQLYAWQAPKVLLSLSKYQGKDRVGRIDRLAWVIANQYWGRLNFQNYMRLPLGSHIELLDAKHPLRPIAKEVEKAILEVGFKQ